MRNLSILCLLLCGPAAPPEDALCGGPRARDRMAEVLYAALEDFRGWVCDGPCTKDEFRALIEFHQETLREQPKALGCFVEQVDKKSNAATGVFVIAKSLPVLQFVFHGIDIGPSPDGEIVRGFRVLVGTERPDPATFIDSYYSWNGKSYLLRNTRQATDKPAK